MGYYTLCAVALFTTAVLYPLVKSKKIRNPPGPKPLPVLGNALDFPHEKPWEVFAKWKEQYGDIIYMNLLGKPMVILNSMTACNDLLVKRADKYSARPRMVMLGELIGFDYFFGLMHYSPRFKKYRGLFENQFTEGVSLKYRVTQERYTHVFLHRLLSEPDNFLSHVKSLYGETVVDAVYDIKAKDNSKRFVEIGDKALAIFVAAGTPGKFLVEIFPRLKYVPSWFPGAKFKRQAAEWSQIARDLTDAPFAYAKKKIQDGKAGPSMISSMLSKYSEEKAPSTGDSPEDVVKACAAIVYLGGGNGTSSIIQTFFLLMANHPEVQRAAHKELDGLLGSTPSRLPRHGDKDQLPFITAITKELLRWHNVQPLGFPHVLTEDDVYNGYTLRKGTTVLTNIWHILRDPELYPEPLAFKPQRWVVETAEGYKVNPNVPDPALTFGSGHRQCPGRFFATDMLLITVANVLACFEIRPLDGQGRPTDKLDLEFDPGLFRYPVPHKVSIVPRSSHLVRLIRDIQV